MSRKKKPGYYYQLIKKMKARFHDEETIFLKDYPERARQYIVIMCFKHLPRVKIVN